MISLDVKPESSSPLVSILSNADEKSTLSFSELLKGAKFKSDDKEIHNGVLILSLEENVKEDLDTKLPQQLIKTETLLSLLKNEKESIVTKPESLESLDLNPELTKVLSSKDLKVVIKNAKEYLKEKIQSSLEYIKSEVNDLPKTLKGLASLAEKFGLDLSKITLEDVESKITEGTLEKKITQEPKVPSKAEVKTEFREQVKVQTKAEVKTELVEQSKQQRVEQVKVQNKTEVKVETKAEVQVQTKAELKSEVKVETKAEVQAQIKAELKSEVKIETKKQVKVQTKAEVKNDETNFKEQVKIDTQIKDIPKEIKSAPLFKAHTQKEHTTEQIVQTKIVVQEHKTPKEKADDTLKLLLRGEKVTKMDSRLTSDFSVATAKVIAPSATTEVQKGLESLLKGDASIDTPDAKLDGLTLTKADSFEVKLNEAKQMVKYLSQDVKTAIEDYKSPFTRVKLQLNPQKLGEVDLTIVQRGKNLHINLSSNNTAINTLAMNANDLKVQLSNNGINNATLNFNSNAQGENNSNTQQQQHQQKQKADEEYNYFENQKTNEEIVSSLEIVVSRYA